jgi:type IV pilus assembly protein PilV
MKNRCQLPCSKNNQWGVTLIEVLVAILVFAIGMLGLAALQSRALANVDSSYSRTQAVLLSYYILDTLRVDRINAVGGSYNKGVVCNTPAGGATFADNAFHDWMQALKATLGNSATTCGEVQCDTASCVVRIFYDDTRGTRGESDQTIETRTTL